jgi:hypothetical protein
MSLTKTASYPSLFYCPVFEEASPLPSITFTILLQKNGKTFVANIMLAGLLSGGLKKSMKNWVCKRP